MSTEEVAKQLYIQYKQGMEAQYIIMPHWEELSQPERTAWETVAEYVKANKFS